MKATAIPFISEDFTDKDYYLLLKVCHSVNRSRFGGARDPNEFLSAAWRGWLEAKQKYDGSKGTRFTTFAVPFIHGRIMDEIRSEMPYSRAVYGMLRKFHGLLDQGVSKTEAADQVTVGCQPTTKFSFFAALVDSDSRFVQDDECVVDELELVPDPSINIVEDLAKAETMVAVRQIIKHKLNWNERQVIEDIYFNELGMREIGLYMELSDGRVGQIARQAVAKIRSYLLSNEMPDRPKRVCRRGKSSTRNCYPRL